MPRQVVELLACWKRRFTQNDFNDVWNAIPFYLMWCIQRELIVRRRTRIYSLVSLNPSSSGSFLTPFSMFLAFQIFVPFFLILDVTGYFPLYTSCDLVAPLAPFNKFAILIKKKIESHGAMIYLALKSQKFLNLKSNQNKHHGIYTIAKCYYSQKKIHCSDTVEVPQHSER